MRPDVLPFNKLGCNFTYSELCLETKNEVLMGYYIHINDVPKVLE